MFDVKKISTMLLAVILAVTCKDPDKKNELSPVEKYPGWSSCPEGVGDAEWAHGACNDIDGDTDMIYVASAYALLSNPNFFDKKIVITCGYLIGDITIENCSFFWVLYPSREDALNSIFTNKLVIEELEYEDEYDSLGIFKHMKLPYEIPACIKGTFSSYVFSPGRTFVPDFGFAAASILKFEGRHSLSILNEKLDSLLIKGGNISEFQWSEPCSPFEIREGKIKYVSVSPDCSVYKSQYESYNSITKIPK